MCCRRRDATRSRQTKTNQNSTTMNSNGATGISDMAGNAAKVAVEHRGSDRDTTRASSAHNYAETATVRQAQPTKWQQRSAAKLKLRQLVYAAILVLSY